MMLVSPDHLAVSIKEQHEAESLQRAIRWVETILQLQPHLPHIRAVAEEAYPPHVAADRGQMFA